MGRIQGVRIKAGTFLHLMMGGGGRKGGGGDASLLKYFRRVSAPSLASSQLYREGKRVQFSVVFNELKNGEAQSWIQVGGG
jgi:hypothetical protein